MNEGNEEGNIGIGGRNGSSRKNQELYRKKEDYRDSSGENRYSERNPDRVRDTLKLMEELKYYTVEVRESILKNVFG